jgi:hypothetical protein
MKYSTLLATGFLGLMSAQRVMAATTPFALRHESAGVSIHGGVTGQTVETDFGTNALGMPFTGSNTYDFYSPAISTPITLSASQKTGGLIVMSNSAPTDANDFTVFGWMMFYDYDPVSGTDTFVAKARQPANAARRVNHGETAKWILVQAPQNTDYTIPAGHLLHIVVSLVLNSGDPGAYGQLIYNGPQGSSSMALFPRNASIPVSWTPASLVQMTPAISSIVALPDGTVQLTCTGAPTAYYLIQATSNLGDLSSWTTISTNLTDNACSIQWTDTDAANHPFRFYRLATP